MSALGLLSRLSPSRFETPAIYRVVTSLGLEAALASLDPVVARGQRDAKVAVAAPMVDDGACAWDRPGAGTMSPVVATRHEP